MIPTTPSDRFEDFLAFLAAASGEEFEEVLAHSRGASGRELVPLMTLCRFPLPRLYVDYLKRFGHGDGGLDLFGEDAYADLDELVSRYRAFERVDYRPLPDDAVLFATGTLTGDLLLLYPDGDPPGEPLVALADFEDKGVVRATLAESFTHYAYARAFCRFHLPYKDNTYVNLLGRERNLTRAVTAAAERRGLAAYWFSDVYTSCLERDGLVIHTEQSVRGTEVYLTGPQGRGTSSRPRSFGNWV